MTFNSQRFSLLVATAFCAAWTWFVWSDQVADNAWLALPLGLVLVGATYLAVRHLSRSQVSLGWIVLLVCTFTLALLMFTAWALFLSIIPYPSLSDTLPKPLRISALFVIGPVAAAMVACIFAYPLAVLLPRVYWIVPVLAGLLVLLFQYEGTTDEPTKPLTWTLLVFELACLLVLVPVLVRQSMSKVIGQTRGSG